MKTNNISKLVLSVVAALSVQACTGFKQDPFADKNEAIKNAVEDEVTPDNVKAVVTDHITFDLQGDVTFIEGVNQIVKFNVKSYLRPGAYTYRVELANLSEFEYADFDPVTAEFIWRPGFNVVPSNKNFVYKDMKFYITATPVPGSGSSTIIRDTEIVRIFIENDTAKPEVFRVDAPNLMVTEGEQLTFDVYVKDNSTTQTTRPELRFMSRENRKTVAPYVQVGVPTYDTATNLWKFIVTVDLKNADITKSRDSAPLLVFSTNEMGSMSVPKTVDLTVQTKLDAAKVTLAGRVTFKAGQENVHSFTIYDPNGESTVSLVSHLGLPAGATINCNSMSRVTFSECKIVWTPAAREAGAIHNVELTLQTKGSHYLDTRTVTGNEIVKFEVVR